MKNLHFIPFILLIMLSSPVVPGASAQASGEPNDTAFVYPAQPSAKDSVCMTYVYTSTDGCPDFYLTNDSVAPGKIYVSLRKLPETDRACTTVITRFKAHINLGTITRDTDIYFNDKLYKSISAPCSPDRTGVVTACGGKLYIQDIYAESVTPQLYIFNYSTYTDRNGNIQTKPLPGDSVKFGGVVSVDNLTTDTECKTAGKVLCYRIITAPPTDTVPPCVIDKSGVVVKCRDRLYFEDTSTPYASPVAQLYFIKGITDNSADISYKLQEGDKVKFGGYPVKIDSDSNLCHIAGVAACYRLIDSTSACIMDKKGIVEDGIDGCTGRLFIREILTRNLYAIRDSSLNSTTRAPSLKAGDKVVFGGYLTPNDSNKVVLCPVAGIAVCYRIIESPAACKMDKEGIVERGKDACSRLWFVRETTTQNLYYVKNGRVVYSDGSVRYLNPGDKLRFGAVPVSSTGYDVNLCNAVGIVNCFEITQTADSLTFSGYAMAGNDIVKSGTAILFEKGIRKCAALVGITNGTFTFGRLHPAAYTVYVIPDKELYSNYLPTFYIDKLYYKTADFVELNQNIRDVVVKMKYYDWKTGTGKIYGNIYYESYKLNDSLMVRNALMNTEGTANYNLAVNATVLLFNKSNDVVAWTLTDVNGNYVFTDIPLDTYTVVSETASAFASTSVVLTAGQSSANRDLMLKSTEGTTGISEPVNPVLSLYPNPVKDKVTIVLAQESEILIYNLNGQLHNHRQLNAGINIVDLSNMTAGVYIARIGAESFKLIKY